jgi:hypothetical protein
VDWRVIVLVCQVINLSKEDKSIASACVPQGPVLHGISKHGTLRNCGKFQENLQMFRHFFQVQTLSSCLLLLNSGKSIIMSVLFNQNRKEI